MVKVLITGGSGYLALHTIGKFLKNGFAVRTSLRSMDRVDEVRNTINDEKLQENLEFCKLDLMEDEGWDDAVKGCDYVIHMASPVIFKNLPNENTVIDPAKDGLLRAIKHSVKHKVKRFVMTSSVAAIYSDDKNQKEVYDHNDWVDLSDGSLSAYSKSKTMAEMALWEYINSLEGDYKIEACAINPAIVVGRSLSDDMGKSNIVVKRMLDRSLPFNAKINVGIVDVDDVAEIHFRAATYPNVDGKRFLLSERSVWLSDISDILMKNGFTKALNRVAPNFLIKFFAFFDPQVKMLVSSLGKYKTFDCSVTKETLKWEPTNIERSVVEAAKQYQELELI